MTVVGSDRRISPLCATAGALLLLCAGALQQKAFCQEPAPKQPSGSQQESADKQADSSKQDKSKADATIVGDNEPAPEPLPSTQSIEERTKQAWRILTDAATDTKHPQTRIQALAALGIMTSPQSEKMILDAMDDPDVDVRTAAALAAGQTQDHNFSSKLRDLLDDSEPQVAFTAATTLWRMGDRSGEDILMAVVDGDRSASATLWHGTQHKISRDLHSPGTLARLGALQGASLLLGPFGFGIAAYEYLRKNGGDLSRVSAIEQLAQEKTEPVHKDLMDALIDKDPAVRAAAAKALASYRDKPTSAAIFPLLSDPKYPVRLTAAAAYLRTTGVPGPVSESKPATTRRPKMAR